MKFSKQVLSLTVLSCCFLLAGWKSAPLPASPKRLVEIQHVAGPIHMLTGPGGNLGVSVGADGVLLIDDKFANLAEQIQVSLDELASEAKLPNGKPRFLVNTHHHGDHTGGNPHFGTSATIVAHTNVRKRLSDNKSGDAMATQGLPIVTFEDGLSIHFNGEEIRLLHLPAGHTDGDTVVFFTGSNVVHMGDLGFIGLFPYIDAESGGTVAGFITNLGSVLERTKEDTLFIPGHGDLASRSEVLALRSMLQTVEGLVRDALSQGKTAKDMIDEDLLAEYESWSWNFITSERMIQTVVDELEAK